MSYLTEQCARTRCRVAGAMIRSDLRTVDANRRFEFHKRSQLFIRSYNETLSVGAMRVSNPDRSPVESIAET